MIGRRGALLGLMGLAAGRLGVAEAQPGAMQYFRIAAGPIQSRYFQFGTALAESISAPTGMRACGRDRVCGVPGLIGIATTTKGPQDNLRLVAGRHAEGGLVPAALLAMPQPGAAAGQAKRSDALCVLAPLHEELVHLVVMADSPIARLSDLKGRRICLGDDSSGGPLLAQQILAAAGLQAGHMETAELPLAQAAESLVEREIDAFFCVEGQPSPTIRELCSRAEIRLIPIGPEHGLRTSIPFCTAAAIANEVYRAIGRTATLGVLAVWAGHGGLDAEFAYAVTRAAWHAENRLLRDATAASGALRRAADLDLPFHPGAKRFYRDLMPS
jgi:TRAP transporter TAXI family solute receptor